MAGEGTLTAFRPVYMAVVTYICTNYIVYKRTLKGKVFDEIYFYIPGTNRHIASLGHQIHYRDYYIK